MSLGELLTNKKLFGQKEPKKKDTPKETKLCLCPKCQIIPNLKIYNPYQVEVNCNCKQNEKMFIQNFVLDYEESKNSKGKGKTTTCEQKKCTSKKADIYLYCEDCQIHLCDSCSKKHSDHNILNLRNFKKELSKKNYEGELREAIRKININNMEIKNKAIGLLREQMEMIEKAYEENKQLNQTLINFAQIIIRNANDVDWELNYNNIENLSRINFNLKGFEPLKMSTFSRDAFSYFKKDIILESPTDQ